MLDRGYLLLSVVGLLLGTMFFLFPNALLRASQAMNRVLMAAADEQVMRYRYLVGLLFYLASYGIFKLALLLSANPLTLLVHH